MIEHLPALRACWTAASGWVALPSSFTAIEHRRHDTGHWIDRVFVNGEEIFPGHPWWPYGVSNSTGPAE